MLIPKIPYTNPTRLSPNRRGSPFPGFFSCSMLNNFRGTIHGKDVRMSLSRFTRACPTPFGEVEADIAIPNMELQKRVRRNVCGLNAFNVKTVRPTCFFCITLHTNCDSFSTPCGCCLHGVPEHKLLYMTGILP